MHNMKKVFVFLAATFSLLFGFRSCQNASDGGKNAVGSMPGSGENETLPAETFAQRIMSKSVVLVDVRAPNEFSQGHLQGAVNVPWGDDFERAWKATGIETRYTVAVYCRRGRRSKAAAARLNSMGYRTIGLDGGIVAWQKAGKPVEK